MKVKNIDENVVVAYRVLRQEIERTKRETTLATFRRKSAAQKQQDEAQARRQAEVEKRHQAFIEAQIQEKDEIIQKLEIEESEAAAAKEYARAGECKDEIGKLSSERKNLQGDLNAHRQNGPNASAGRRHSEQHMALWDLQLLQERYKEEIQKTLGIRIMST